MIRAATPISSIASAVPPPGAGTAEPLRILLVEDHVILREGLRSLLEINPEFTVVGEAGTTREALLLVERLQPTLVITDISLPDRSGIELLNELRTRYEHIHLMVLTAHKSPEYIRAALRAGAIGYILKDASHAELIQGLRAVCAGRRFLCEAVASTVLSSYVSDRTNPEEQTPEALITEREREVLTRIARGQSNKHAARDLGLSVKTVEKHRSNLMRKLKLHNTAALTMFAIRHGLVGEDATAGG